MKRKWAYLLVVGVIFAADQLIKYRWTGEIFENSRSGLLIPIIALTAIILASIKSKREQLMLPIAFIIGGGISNIADLLSRGAVIDYMRIKNFYFNGADIAILSGVLILTFRLNQKPENIA